MSYLNQCKEILCQNKDDPQGLRNFLAVSSLYDATGSSHIKVLKDTAEGAGDFD